jgi:hypothetical protein
MACEVCMILAGSVRSIRPPSDFGGSKRGCNRDAARMPCPNCNEPAPGERPTDANPLCAALRFGQRLDPSNRAMPPRRFPPPWSVQTRRLELVVGPPVPTLEAMKRRGMPPRRMVRGSHRLIEAAVSSDHMARTCAEKLVQAATQ